MILSICIATLDKRKESFDFLKAHLDKQIAFFPGLVEIVSKSDDGTTLTTGAKRNMLYQEAKGEYVCSVDDDDWVPDYYVREILDAVKTHPDTVALCGSIVTDGRKHEGWSISIFNPYHTVKKMGQNFYLRYPNHLSPIRREIALQYPFPDQYHEEDYIFAKSMHDANALKTEVMILRHMYEYRYSSTKK